MTILAKMAKETGFLLYCLVKCITCLLDRGYRNIITYGKLSGVPLNILSSVFVFLEVWVQTSFSVHFIVVVIGDNNKARFHCQE